MHQGRDLEHPMWIDQEDCKNNLELKECFEPSPFEPARCGCALNEKKCTGLALASCQETTTTSPPINEYDYSFYGPPTFQTKVRGFVVSEKCEHDCLNENAEGKGPAMCAKCPAGDERCNGYILTPCNRRTGEYTYYPQTYCGILTTITYADKTYPLTEGRCEPIFSWGGKYFGDEIGGECKCKTHYYKPTTTKDPLGNEIVTDAEDLPGSPTEGSCYFEEIPNPSAGTAPSPNSIN